MTKMKLKSDFEFAQHPVMWLGVADTLTHSAHPIYFGAVEQMTRYEEASARAFDEAERRWAEDPGRSVTVDIDCEAPAFLPAFLLYGFAVENLLKGIYVSKNPEAIHDQRLQVPAVHDLPHLARQSGYSPTEEEAELLARLSTVTVWSGRYPVARNRQQHGSMGLNREGIFADPVAAGLAIHALIKKLQALLDDDGRRKRSRGGAVIVGL